LDRFLSPTWPGSLSSRSHAAIGSAAFDASFAAVGSSAFADVLAFCAYYSLRLSRADRNWEEDARARLARGLPVVPCSIPRFVTDDPNNRVTRRFIDAKSPT
jgi:hypothetical protein